MTNAHYIIFHPDHQRQCVAVEAKALVHDQLHNNWRGSVFVDKLDDGTEDPFVFHDPWLYSYCHASQMRRSLTNDNRLAEGSWLFFVSGQSANNGTLAFDTIFLVSGRQAWQQTARGLQLPQKYLYLRKTPKNLLYQKYFRWPIMDDIHSSVAYTYEADIWSPGKSQYPFLPLDAEGQKPTIRLSELSPGLGNLVINHVPGKYPVPLTERQALSILVLLEDRVITRVVGNMNLLQERGELGPGCPPHPCIC
jgi:hypothetical protein